MGKSTTVEILSTSKGPAFSFPLAVSTTVEILSTSKGFLIPVFIAASTTVEILSTSKGTAQNTADKAIYNSRNS